MFRTKKRFSVFVFSMVAVCSFFMKAAISDITYVQAYVGDVYDYHYSVNIVEDDMTIKVEDDSPITMLMRVDGNDTKWSSGEKTIQLPNNKEDMTIDLYWGSGNYGVFNKLVTLCLKQVDGNWVIVTNNVVFDKNASQIGTMTDDALTSVSSSVKKLSDNICAGAANDYEKARLIHDWVCANIYYNKDDNGLDKIGTIKASDIIESKLTHCGGYQEVFQSLCQAQDIPCVNVYGTTDPVWKLKLVAANKNSSVSARYWTHGWNECYVDGRWIIVDCTWDSGCKVSGGKKYSSEVGHAYFDCDLQFFSLSHLALSREGTVTGNTIVATDTATNTTSIGFSDWAKSDVEMAYKLGLVPIELMSNGTSAITRGEFCRMAVQMLEVSSGKSVEDILDEKQLKCGSFTDTSDSDILAANALGIVGGYGDGRFGPDGNIKRQEAAAILARTASVMGLEMPCLATLSFADNADIGSWAVPSVSFCKTAGIMQGKDGNCFDPLGTYSREQSVVTILRLFNAQP